MGTSILDILNPVKAIGDLADRLIHDFVPDPAQKAALQAELLTATTNLQAKAIDASAQLASAQAAVVTAEATGKDVLERDWRPILMLFFGVVIGFMVFNGGHDVAGRDIPAAVNEWVLRITALGVGGYIGGQAVQDARTLQNGLPNAKS